MFDEVKMRIVGYSLMTFGFVFVVSGIVAVFHYDQPADVFSLAWWMIVGGWCCALIGIGMDIIQLFTMDGNEAAPVFQPETTTAKGVEEEVT